MSHTGSWALSPATGEIHNWSKETTNAVVDAFLDGNSVLMPVAARGRAFYGTNDLDHALEESMIDGASYYKLAIDPQQNWDGRYRKLRVRSRARAASSNTAAATSPWPRRLPGRHDRYGRHAAVPAREAGPSQNKRSSRSRHALKRHSRPAPRSRARRIKACPR